MNRPTGSATVSFHSPPGHRKKRPNILAASVAALFAALILGPAREASAATTSWTAGTSDVWELTSNWTSGIPGSGDTAVLNSAASTITLSGAQPVQNIQFTGPGFTVGAAGSSNQLQLTSGGEISTSAFTASASTVNAPIVLEGANATYTFSSGNSGTTAVLNFTGAISGGAAGNTVLTLTGSNTGANTISGIISDGSATTLGLVVTASGPSMTWVLTGVNTFTGGTTVNSGTLQLGDGADAAALIGGNGSNGTNGVSESSGSNGSIAVTNNATLTILAHATITGGGGGSGANDSSASGGSGGGGGSGVSSSSGGSLTNSGSITGGAGGAGGFGGGFGTGGHNGSGGSGGAGVSMSGGGSLNNGGSITGGAGAMGGNGNGSEEGGGGGNGGVGVSLGGGGVLINSNSITGGAGAAGGSAIFIGGNGGNGGVGAMLSGGSSLSNSGSITGGSGANNGSGNIGGSIGSGGAGVSLSGGGSLTNSGTITPGDGGGGGPAGTGAVFTGGGTLNNQNGGVINGGVSMDNSQNAVTLQIGSTINGALNIGTNTSSTLTLTDNGTSGTQTYFGASSAAVSGATSFDGSLIKNGAGTWILNQAFTYAGSTTIASGTLQLTAGGSLPATTDLALGAGRSSTGGTLDLHGVSQTVDGISIASGSTAGANNIITTSGGPATLTVSSATTNSSFSGVLADGTTGVLSLVKAGAGTTLILTGASTYTGGTTINGGTLFVKNTAGSATGSGAVVVNSGGTLGGSGSIAGAVTLNSGGAIAPGAGVSIPGTTLSAGSLTWNGGGTVTLQVGASSNDQLALSGALTKGVAGAYTLDIVTTGLQQQNEYTLATFNSTNFTVSDFSLVLPTGFSGSLLETSTALDLLTSANVSGPVIQNSGPVNTSTFADFTIKGPVTTGTPQQNNTISALIFTPGSSLQIFNTLTVTSGSVTDSGGISTIIGGTLSGPNGLFFDLTGQMFVSSALQGDLTKTGLGSLFINGSLQGNAQVLQGILGGTGIIHGNLANSATVAPGDAPGTLTVTGNYSQSPSGSLVIGIGGAHTGQYDALAVGGAASLNGALQLERLNNFTLQRGNVIPFLTAGQGITGGFSSIADRITSKTIIQPELVFGPNSISLAAEQGSFQTFAKNARLSPNEIAIGHSLDESILNPKANAFINYLDSQSLSKLPGDLVAIDPEQLTSMFTVATSLANVQAQNLERRTEDIRSGSSGFSADRMAVNGDNPSYSGAVQFRTGMAAGPNGPDGKEELESKEVSPPPVPNDRWGAFLSGTGEWVKVGDSEGARGYDLQSGGFTLGVDYKFTDNFAIGLSFGYTGSSVDLTNSGRIFVNGGKVGLYSTWFDGGWYVDTAVNGGLNNYDTHRSALQSQANGQTNGGEFNGLFNTGYDFKKGAFVFGPTASFNYTYVGTGGFIERGSLAPLDIHGGNEDSIRTALGFKVRYDWKIGGVLIKPELRVAWQHEFGDTTYTLDSNFANGAGGAFTVAGPTIGRDSALLSGGFAIQWSDRFSTYVYYDGELGCANYHVSSVSGGCRLEF